MLEFLGDLKSVNDTSIILRLCLAVILGGVIGFERGRTGRPAGLRTHILVCLGSALVMLTNQYVFQTYGVGDPVRMAAQVIPGIGFLGAGTILVTGKHQVKGLTTAAGLWATSCMGLAIGIGFYKASIITCTLIFFVTVVLHRLDNSMLSKAKIMDVYIEFNNERPVSYVIKKIKSETIKIEEVELVKPNENVNNTAAVMTLHLKNKKVRIDIITMISEIEGVECVEEI